MVDRNQTNQFKGSSTSPPLKRRVSQSVQRTRKYKYGNKADFEKCRHIRPEHVLLGFEQRQCKNYKTYHAWYSQQFKDRCKEEDNHHSSIAYLNKNLDRVKQISFVTKEKSLEKCLQWDDLVYLGTVIKWDCLGRRAKESEEDLEDEEPDGPAKRTGRNLK